MTAARQAALIAQWRKEVMWTVRGRMGGDEVCMCWDLGNMRGQEVVK